MAVITATTVLAASALASAILSFVESRKMKKDIAKGKEKDKAIMEVKEIMASKNLNNSQQISKLTNIANNLGMNIDKIDRSLAGPRNTKRLSDLSKINEMRKEHSDTMRHLSEIDVKAAKQNAEAAAVEKQIIES